MTIYCDKCDDAHATTWCTGCLGYYCDACAKSHKHRNDNEIDGDLVNIESPPTDQYGVGQ